MDEFNSASGVSNVQSYGDFYNDYMHSQGQPVLDDPNSLMGRFTNWISGKGKSAEQAYDAYLTANERAYEQAKIKDARDYETWLQSTQYQRAVKDMEKAGLNPYLLVTGNGMSGATARASGSSARSATDSHESYQGTGKKSDAAGVLASLVGSALKVLAVLAA